MLLLVSAALAAPAAPLPAPAIVFGQRFTDAEGAAACPKDGLVYVRDDTHMGCYPNDMIIMLDEWALERPPGAWTLMQWSDPNASMKEPGSPGVIGLAKLVQRLPDGVGVTDAMSAFLDKHGREGALACDSTCTDTVRIRYAEKGIEQEKVAFRREIDGRLFMVTVQFRKEPSWPAAIGSLQWSVVKEPNGPAGK